MAKLESMPWWWRTKKATKPKFSITPRGEDQAASRVNLGALAPPLADYLASSCVLTQYLAGELARLSKEAWGSEDADDLARASGVAIDRYRQFRTMLEDHVGDVSDALAGPRERLGSHVERFDTTRWYEAVGTCYVLTGFTRDFWHLLAEGFPGETCERLQEILSDQGDEDLLAHVLERFLAADDRYSSRLSLWCRRLVGDIILMCRDALSPQAMQSGEVELRLEPVLTDVVAQHTRRLDRLGLAA